MPKALLDSVRPPSPQAAMAFHHIAHTLAWCAGAEDLARTAMAEICGALGVDIASVMILDAARETLVLRFGHGPSPLSRELHRLRLDESPFAREALEARWAVAFRTAEHPDPWWTAGSWCAQPAAGSSA